MIRLTYFFSIALMLSSCSGFAVYQASYNFFKDNLIPDQQPLISESFFQDEKFSFALVRIGNAPEIKMVLASIDNGLQKWVSSDGFSIITNSSGRILRTQGLLNDVSYVKLSESSESSIDYIIDFYNPELLKIKGIEAIKTNPELINYKYFIDKDIQVSQISFVTKIPVLKWSQVGILLKDEKKPVYTSQKIHPHFPRIQINFYYKFD